MISSTSLFLRTSEITNPNPKPLSLLNQPLYYKNIPLIDSLFDNNIYQEILNKPEHVKTHISKLVNKKVKFK